MGLRDLEDAPDTLYVRGALPPRPGRAVAIVGSRAASPYGRAVTERLAGDLARLGYGIISGLARGIDAAAHQGAMAVGGMTWAVLPSGLDQITPRHHQALAESITARGGLLTENAGGGIMHSGAFVHRNRLIAALAAVTVVVEAATRSGALWTAAAARPLGRIVMAVPGDVDRETARGCHRLLREGAWLCEEASDVVRAAEGWRREHDPLADDETVGGSTETRVWRVLSPEPESVEALAHKAGVDLSEALAALLALQWTGSVECRPGQRWARVDA